VAAKKSTGELKVHPSKIRPKFTYRLAQPRVETFTPAPLYFFQKTQRIVVSKEEQLRRLEDKKKKTIEAYSVAKSITRTFTALLPRVISALLKQQITKIISTNEIRKIIRAAY